MVDENILSVEVSIEDLKKNARYDHIEGDIA